MVARSVARGNQSAYTEELLAAVPPAEPKSGPAEVVSGGPGE